MSDRSRYQRVYAGPHGRRLATIQVKDLKVGDRMVIKALSPPGQEPVFGKVKTLNTADGWLHYSVDVESPDGAAIEARGKVELAASAKKVFIIHIDQN